MTKLDVVRPDLQALLPTEDLSKAFENKSASFEAGRFVREMRRRAGLTQQQLAIRLHVTQARISALESGDGSEGPTYGLLKRLVVACGLKWNPYFGLDDLDAAEDENPNEDRDEIELEAEHIYQSFSG